jgi:phosphoribosylformimino-5-aminoimidazole carboxamide ribotide isomerase
VRLIGVVDLLGGRAVHARAGRRDAYAPVARAAGAPLEPPGDAPTLARSYLDALGVRELYVADLDAILHGRPDPDGVRALTVLGARVWLDAAVTDATGAREARTLGAAEVVVGLETLPSFDALRAIADAIGRTRVAFSLDLRDGVPLTGGRATLAGDAATLVTRAVDAGADSIIVLDLARVGTGAGLDLALLGRLRAAAPTVTLLAGGGVRGEADLAALSDAGCDGALVASALLDGRLDAAAVARTHAR